MICKLAFPVLYVLPIDLTLTWVQVKVRFKGQDQLSEVKLPNDILLGKQFVY